ncbi:MAG TPA: Gfo/Idh/MocA family oxidoreductase [Pirellulales bacterium]|nr:Gfo/Idh/MocA family oxidoreductase [Pirellulales bacterium]
MTHPPRPLKLGLLGAGAAMRKLHLPALAKLRGEIELTAVWSRSAERAVDLAAEAGIDRSFADYRDLLADPTIDAVLIAVPIELNAALAIEAIEAGKHVIAEKPIAATTAEARQVLNACRSTQCVVLIAENFRYRDDILEAKRLVESGAIGRVQCFQMTAVFDLLRDIRRVYMEQPWRQQPKHAGGLAVDAGIHAVSGLREILGDVDHVYARLLNNSPATSGPDGLLMQLGLVSGAPGHYFSCYSAKTDRETVFDLSVYGDEGSLWLTEGKVEWLSTRTGERNTWQAAAPDRGYVGQWRNFVAAVRGSEPVYSTSAKAYNDLLVLECALSSAASGQRVSVGEGVAE